MEDSKVAVLLEHLESQLKTIADAVNMVDEKIDTHIEENRREFHAIQKNFDDNRQDHQLMIQMIRELNEEQAKLKRAK